MTSPSGCTCCTKNAARGCELRWFAPSAKCERSDLVRGFELSKGNYVPTTEEDLESLEAEANNGIEFREFVPVEKLDPVYF